MVRFRTRRPHGAWKKAAVVAVALPCGSVWAQQQDSPSAAAEPVAVEEILVTGSYLRRTDTPNPISVLSREQFEQTPRAALADVLSLAPELGYSAVYFDASANSQSPAAFVNLRGLGPRGTLVLLNGKRMAFSGEPDGQGNFGVDINSLTPAIMLQRVEMVKDGASALYGSDAVAGVVNFITRSEFDGASVEVANAREVASGQDELSIGAIVGGGNFNSHFTIAGEFVDREGYDVLEHDEALRYSSDLAANTAALSSFGSPGSFSLIPGETYNATVPPGPRPRFVRDPLCGDPSLGPGLVPGVQRTLGPGTVCSMDTRLGRQAIGKQRRFTGMAQGRYEVSDRLRTGGELSFTRNTIERDGGFGFLISTPPLVPAENPGNPFGGDVLYRGRLPGPPSQTPVVSPTESYTWRAAFELGGSLGAGWNWKAELTNSQNRTDAFQKDFINDRLQNALLGLGGPRCNPATGTPGAGDCQYLNPFATRFLAQPGDPAYTDPEVLEYAQGFQLRRSDSRLTTHQLLFTGELPFLSLPGGAPGLAVGFEHRQERLSKDMDPVSQGGGFAFVSQEDSFSADRDFNSAFFELGVPVTDRFEVQLAGRYEEFTDVESFDPKIAVAFRPLQGLTLRATYGTAFRAPNLLNVFGTGDFVATGINVPGIVATSTTATLRPNPDLQPEESESFTGGLQWAPNANLSFNLDYWSFDFSDLAVQESPQLLVQEFVATGANADRLVFDNANELIRIFLTSINAASQKTDGFDFGARWKLDAGGWGGFSFAANATYVSTYEFQERDDTPVLDGLGRSNSATFPFPAPQWKGDLSVGWSLRQHGARLTARYIDGLIDSGIADTDPRQNTSAYTSVDVFYSYVMNIASTPLTLRLGINNVTDELPPFQPSNIIVPFIPGVYDPHGRQIVASVGVSF